MAAIIVMAAIGAWAVITEQVSYVITHGVSMNPVYYQGDLVFVIKHERYRTGQVVAYRDPASGEDVLHRIIGGDATSGYIFKGDNNPSRDPIKPTRDRLIGRATLHVPKGGIWLKPLLSPTGLGMIGFLIFGGLLAGPSTRREIPRGRRKKKVRAMSAQGSPMVTAMSLVRAVGRMTPLARAAVIVVAGLAALAVGLGTLGWMKPTVETKEAQKEHGQSITFSYSATVPRSPAYDGTVVASPDPVFRKLAHRVDVNIHYLGHPGTLSVVAVLSNPSGWHNTIQLAPPESFSSDVADASTALDLNAMDARATAAANAIGISPGAFLVTVKARVTGGGTPFEGVLDMQLDAVQLKLANGPGSLVVTNAAAKARAVTALREIRLFGWSIMTAPQARSGAVLLLLVAAAGAAAITFVARRNLPLRSRSEIERRYPQLLVPVEPMASPPGKPVVNVEDFKALVKLAERYGQMILTWRRPDADDFVVRDEGITYRYRIPLDEPDLQNVEVVDRPNGAGSRHRRAASRLS
jgi:signal peptidase I